MVCDGGEGLAEGAVCAACAGIAEAVARIAPVAISERAQAAGANRDLNLPATSEWRGKRTGFRANIGMTELYVPYYGRASPYLVQ